MKGSFDDEHGIAWIANLLNRIVVQETNFSVGRFRHLFQTQMGNSSATLLVVMINGEIAQRVR